MMPLISLHSFPWCVILEKICRTTSLHLLYSGTKTALARRGIISMALLIQTFKKSELLYFGCSTVPWLLFLPDVPLHCDKSPFSGCLLVNGGGLTCNRIKVSFVVYGLSTPKCRLSVALPPWWVLPRAFIDSPSMIHTLLFSHPFCQGIISRTWFPPPATSCCDAGKDRYWMLFW